jgi:hypothetical protein
MNRIVSDYLAQRATFDDYDMGIDITDVTAADVRLALHAPLTEADALDELAARFEE